MIVKEGRSGRVNPYPMHDIERDVDGILRYTTLPPSLVHMLRTTVDASRTTRRSSSWAANG